MSHSPLWTVFVVLLAVVAVLYLGSLLVSGYFYLLPRNWIDPKDVENRRGRTDNPPVLLLYPVLREAEATMRTTMLSIEVAVQAYAPAQVRVLAIPNADDLVTITALERLRAEFDFLDLCLVPPTSDPQWATIWSDWDANGKAYWWHTGKRQGEMALPPKKTRQMIFALYTVADRLPGDDWLLSYIDADSAVPEEYFLVAAAGNEDYEVIQLTNVVGNLLQTWATSFHAMDHVAWDGSMYPHMSANGKHPFYVLGKGLFFRVADLIELGGFHPWLTIEDPEVGMRLWTNGRRLGISDSYLTEEVPSTFRAGWLQRKRWVAGFFQALAAPLTLMGMTFRQRMRARLNLVPCLSLTVNSVGIPLGIAGLAEAATGHQLPRWLITIDIVNLVGLMLVLVTIAEAAWRRSARVLNTRGRRLVYLLRVNPIALMGYWIFWTWPLYLGFVMFVRDRGLVWERTVKSDANHELVRAELFGTTMDLIDGLDGAGHAKPVQAHP